MKKAPGLATLAALALAASAWRKLSEDLPIDGTIIPPVVGPPRPDPPQCGQFETATWDAETERWRCVPKGVL